MVCPTKFSSVAFAALITASLQAQPRWRASDAFDTVSQSAMASNPKTGLTLRFGGRKDSRSAHDQLAVDATWMLGKSGWLRLHPETSPPPRAGHSMWWDPASERIMIFGGANPQRQTLNDMWSWDGTTWVEHVLPLAPSPRRFAAVTGDPIRRRSLLVGGHPAGHPAQGGLWFQDTWEWNGHFWIQKSPRTTPLGGLLAFCHVLGKPLLLEGRLGGGRDWYFDGDNWHPLNKRPVSVYGEHLLSRPWMNDVLLIGPQALWSWDGRHWSKLLRDPPTPSVLTSCACASPARRAIHLYEPFPTETWQLDSTGWTRSDVRAQPMHGSTYGFDPSEDCFVCIAQGSPRGPNTPVEVWQQHESRWHRVTTTGRGPLGTPFGLIAFEPTTRSLFFYSPWTGNYRLTGKRWSFISNDRSPGHADAMTFDAARGVVLAWSASGLWQFTTTSGWIQKRGRVNPPPRSGPALAYDPARRAVLLVGGYGLPSKSGDTWLWDGSNWRELQLRFKPARLSGAKLTWYSAASSMILSGGLRVFGGTNSPDTWALTDAGFVKLAVDDTTKQALGTPAAILDDSNRGRLRCFYGGRTMSASWHWDLEFQRLKASSQVAESGRSTSLTFVEPAAAGGVAMFMLSTAAHPGIRLSSSQFALPVLPLAADPLWLASLGRHVARLDTAGRASYRLTWPRLSFLVGTELHVAAFAWSPKLARVVVSNRIPLVFVR